MFQLLEVGFGRYRCATQAQDAEGPTRVIVLLPDEEADGYCPMGHMPSHVRGESPLFIMVFVLVIKSYVVSHLSHLDRIRFNCNCMQLMDIYILVLERVLVI